MYSNHPYIPLWRIALILAAAVIPLLMLGWFLIKSSEDSLIAERVRTKEQADRLLMLTAEKVESVIKQENEHLRIISEKKDWYPQLRNDSRIHGIQWDKKSFTLTPRSVQVSHWLLNTERHKDDLKKWFQDEEQNYSRAFVLFALRESNLIDEFPELEEQLKWELSENDARGITLHNDIQVLRNIHTLPPLDEEYEWVSLDYQKAIRRTGFDIGISRITPFHPDNHSDKQKALIIAALIWIFHLILFLLIYARRRERLAQESLDQLSTVAHELRTPLTGIKLLLERLQSSLNKDEQLNKIGQIESERQRLESIVEQFLVQGKLNKQGLQLSSTLWQNWLTNECVRFKSTYNLEHTLHLSLNPPDNTSIFIDQNLMSIVLSNLIKNAKQYGEGGQITIQEITTHAHTGFEVIDEGPGIPPDIQKKIFQKKIFQKYERGEMTLSRHSEGLGLGLSLVKEIVRLHAGRVEIESNVGRGTKVRVILPKS